MDFDTSDPIYQELRERVVRTGARVVPFVGAGLSTYGAPGERLPLWRELLDRLVAEGERLGLIEPHGDRAISEALSAGRYIEATDRLLDVLGEPTFRRTIERELDDHSKPIPPSVTELVAIGWSLVVTTNLDRFIARAYVERHGRPLSEVTNLDNRRLASALAGTLTTPETALAKIHGDIDSYPSWTLTKTHYQQLLNDPRYVEALKHLFLRQVFFVGFGLQDDDFDYLLQVISRIYPAGVGEFYALIDRSRRNDPVIQNLVRESGLRPIFYDVDPFRDPADPFGGHRAVFECLADLARTWARSTTQLEVDLRYFPEIDPFAVFSDLSIESIAGPLLSGAGTVLQVVGLGGSGKTSLVQQTVEEHRGALVEAGYHRVFGCCFYRADVGQFIQDLAYAVAEPAVGPLPEQVDRVCEHVGNQRTLLLLDGMEVLLDDEQRLRNPYMLRIAQAVISGGGSVLVTSRVPAKGELFERSKRIDIGPLEADEVRAVLAHWGLDRLGEPALRRVVQTTAGHPLAIRILAAVLAKIPAEKALETLENAAIISVADEIDPLQENRLARLLGSYLEHLDSVEISLLVCSTVFDGPVTFPLLESILTRDYPDTAANELLVGTDIRPVIADLLERRLLTTDGDGNLSSHPTVREFFSRRATLGKDSLRPLHRVLAERLLESAEHEPTTFAESLPLVAACRHAAASTNWSLFDDVFRRRLMREFRSYLCNNVGAWEEALTLARVGCDPHFPAAQTPEPAYYPITVARCLKHLGRTSEARKRYHEGLAIAARSRDPESARYVNNLLTLLAWRGELGAAEDLIELNIRALSWIDEPWKHRWQTEHALSTIAYLRLLRRDLGSAAALFEASSRVWDDHPSGRVTTFDHYPLHRGELILLSDPSSHTEALDTMTPVLAVAEANGWPEAICRGHIQVAQVLVDAAELHQEPARLVQAVQHLEAALSNTAGMSIADVEVAHVLTQIKFDIVSHEMVEQDRDIRKKIIKKVERAEALVRVTGLNLARPDVMAARSLVAQLEGQRDAAGRGYDDAVAASLANGAQLAPSSPRYVIGWLGGRLDRHFEPGVEASSVDPLQLLGSELAAEQMLTLLQ